MSYTSDVYDAMVVENETLNADDSQTIWGGTAIRTIINSGGTQNVFSGGTASKTTVNNGGEQYVYFGGSSLDTKQEVGGNITVDVMGDDSSTEVTGTNDSGDFSYINGVANNFILYDGGYQYVSYGGTASNTIISYGGRQVVSLDGTALDTKQEVGGNIYVTVQGGDTATLVTGTNASATLYL